jgi:hypothetical protein
MKKRVSVADANAAAARVALLARLKSQTAVKGAMARRRWTPDELYDGGKRG